MDRQAFRLALARNCWPVLGWVCGGVALSFHVDHHDWTPALSALVAFLSLSLAIYIWLDYREEAAKTRVANKKLRSTMWRRDRWIATAAQLGAGVVWLFFLVQE